MHTSQRRSRRKRNKPIAEINTVPYIDVMLVLLVIFMVATPLLTQGVKVNLPSAHSKNLQSQQLPIIITVNA
jgi:biopolymer transport protein TolR